MKNSSDEKYRAINTTDLQKSANNIPVEIIDKFPEYKIIIEMINQMVTEGYGVKEIEQKIMQSKEYISLEKKQVEIHKFQDEMEGIDVEKVSCPCCGYKTLDEDPPGTYDICPICFWEDDGVQFEDLDYEGGTNDVLLRQGQRNFLEFEACEKEMLEYVRNPNENDICNYSYR